ncbi:MAG: hypothetical protein SPJ15_01710 [Anaerococcus sp.]|nr:hypothetical protein [Anaerococcus sp.]
MEKEIPGKFCSSSMTYLERTTCSPIYPNWFPAGKYKYHTKYYSDKNRKHLIGETNYING